MVFFFLREMEVISVKKKKKKMKKPSSPNPMKEKKKKSESKVVAGGFLGVCLIMKIPLKTELLKLKTPKMCFQFP